MAMCIPERKMHMSSPIGYSSEPVICDCMEMRLEEAENIIKTLIATKGRLALSMARDYVETYLKEVK